MPNKPVAVITGTSTGFGYLAAERFAKAGYTVFGTMRDTSGRNAEPKKKLEAAGVTVVEMDVTDQKSVDAGAAKIHAATSVVDVLVNNAGTAHMGVSEAFTPEAVEKQFATNFLGPVRLNRAFLPGMRERKSGLVIYVSSVVGRFIIPFTGVYAASKFAVEALAESMSYELRPFGVDVAIVEPGAYATNILNVTIPPDDTARNASYGEYGSYMDKLGASLSESAGDAAEVADAILALAQMPAHERPLRMPVPAESPATAINAAVEPIQRGVLEAFGMGDFLPKIAATR